MRKSGGRVAHHRDVRNRAQSVHGARIFPSGGIREAQVYRCPAFDELSFPVRAEPHSLHEKQQSRYACGG